jgi:hypothetical protein
VREIGVSVFPAYPRKNYGRVDPDNVGIDGYAGKKINTSKGHES